MVNEVGRRPCGFRPGPFHQLPHSTSYVGDVAESLSSHSNERATPVLGGRLHEVEFLIVDRLCCLTRRAGVQFITSGLRIKSGTKTKSLIHWPI